MILYEENISRMVGGGALSPGSACLESAFLLSTICVNLMALTVSKSHCDSSGLGMVPFIRWLLGEMNLDQLNRQKSLTWFVHYSSVISPKAFAKGGGQRTAMWQPVCWKVT